MNTISSLFNWLGNLVGADPNTLTTTSKTLVGAINEVDAEFDNTVHITESGTSGNWTYRKWSDGTSECWGRFERTATSWTQWGSLYIANPYNVQETYPTGLFTQTPKATAEIMACSQDMFLSIGFTPAGSSTNTPAYYGARGSNGSANATYSIAIRAIGKWQ